MGCHLKDRKCSQDLYNLRSINCTADVVTRGRLRCFCHLERKSVDVWVPACQRVGGGGDERSGTEFEDMGTVC